MARQGYRINGRIQLISTRWRNLSDIPGWAWFLLFFLVALFVRLINIGVPSLRHDEIITFVKSSFDWETLLSSSTDNKPPLFYILTKPFLAFGGAEFTLRLSSAIFGSAAVAMGYYLGRQFPSTKARYILPSLLLVNDTGIYLSQDARHYSLLTLCLLIMLTGVFQLVRTANSFNTFISHIQSNKGAISLAIIGSTLCLYTHPLSIFYLFPVLAGVVCYAIYSGTWRVLLPNTLAVTGFSTLLWLPWLVGFLRLMHSGTYYHSLEQPELAYVIRTVMGFLGVDHFWLIGDISDLMFLSATIVGLLLIARNFSSCISLIIFFSIVLTPTLMWATGFLLKPIFVFRYVMPLHIYFAISLTGFLVFIRWKRVRVVTSVLMMAMMAKSAQAYLVTNDKSKEQWRESVMFIQKAKMKNDVVLICRPEYYKGALYYLRSQDSSVISLFKNKLITINWKRGEASTRMAWLGREDHLEEYKLRKDQLQRIDKIYLLERHGSCDNISVKDVLRDNGLEVKSEVRIADFRNIDIFEFKIR